MKRYWLVGSVLMLGFAALPAHAQWGEPPVGYRPPVVTQPDGAQAPCTDRYGLCSAWRRKHSWKTACPYGMNYPCDQPSFWDRLRYRSGLLCLYP